MKKLFKSAVCLTIALALSVGFTACEDKEMTDKETTSQETRETTETITTQTETTPADTSAETAPADTSAETAPADTSTETKAEDSGLKLGEWNVFDYKDTNLEYGILLPDGYDPEVKYPYFIYIHGHGYGGYGAGGSDPRGYNWQTFSVYLDSLGFLDGEGVRDCVILAPHLKVKQGEASWWSNSFNLIGWGTTDIPYDTTPASQNLLDLYELIVEIGDTLNVDKSRIYTTGASDGGYAIWELITRHPDYFTAAIPLCGAGDTSKAELLKDFPVYFFHGTADPTVKVEAATKMEAALKGVGSTKYVYKPLAGLDHGISKAAYATEGLWEWLFEQVKE